MISRRLLTFIAVGSTAALVHWATVVTLVRTVQAAPLAANVGGWMVAFCVSFAGQSNLTFRGHGVPVAQAVRRFFALSFGGFVLNETAYALLLRYSPWRYDLLLAIVLVGVAVATYLLSRHWAFRRS